MRIWVLWAARLTIVVLGLATFVGIVAADAWWIRVFDFPRVQFAMLLLVAIAVSWTLRRTRDWPWQAIGVAAVAFQAYQVVPYSSVYPVQAVAADNCTPERTLRLLSINVLQDNREYGRTIDLIQRERPDIVLVMENDAAWTEALGALDADYPYSRKVPLGNKYGMALFSRLPLSELAVEELAGDDTPMIRTRIEMGGVRPALFAVHPLPPRPGQGSGQRDAELILLADMVRDSGRPSLVVGDFNDVPWSSVTETFQRTGQLIDPRVGRGYYPSFDATNPLVRWPLDHVFHTDDFGVMRFETGPGVGSDHFPLLVTLCLDEARFEDRQEAPELTDETREDAREELEDAARDPEAELSEELLPEE